MDSGKILLGVLAGVAAGAIIGILFAPAKGSETRKKILNKTGDYSDELKEKFNEFIDGIAEKYENVKEGASDFADHFTAKPEEEDKNKKHAHSL